MIDVEFWTPQRARLLGALIEKGLATPQNYPLSLNALVGACNQTTNRDPITDYTESEVESLLDQAKTDGLARFVHPRSGRGVTKYRHVVDEALSLEQDELALIGVLLLRGPQTVSELRSRTERLAGFASNDEVSEALDGLVQRQAGALVARLEREPGHRERRWIQLLCPAQGEDRSRVSSSTVPTVPSVSTQPGEPELGPVAGMPDPFAVGDAAAGAGGADAGGADAEVQQSAQVATSDWSEDAAELRSEVLELRSEVLDLRTELEELRAGFDSFRRQFE